VLDLLPVLFIPLFLNGYLRTFRDFGFAAGCMSVMKNGERKGLYSPHSIEFIEPVDCRPVENECCDISICDLWTHGVDDGD
jgi:hypothetical protein